MRRATLQRFTLICAIAAPLAGCELVLDVGDDVDEPTPEPRDELADQFNDDVLPLLNQRCSACHDGSLPGIDFMAIEGSPYQSVRRWPALINVADPVNSRLITKGWHDGPAWLPAELDIIVAWLEAEAEARN